MEWMEWKGLLGILHNAVNWNPWSTRTCTIIVIGIMIVPWEKTYSWKETFFTCGNTYGKLFSEALPWWLFAQTFFVPLSATVLRSTKAAILEQKCKHFFILNRIEIFNVKYTSLVCPLGFKRIPLTALCCTHCYKSYLEVLKKLNPRFREIYRIENWTSF